MATRGKGGGKRRGATPRVKARAVGTPAMRVKAAKRRKPATAAKAAPKPAKRPVRRRARKAFSPAFATQRAAATAKELLLFELERARVAVSAAIQGMSPASAERPIAPGKWSPREIVLHLAMRDQARLDEFDAVLAGATRSWASFDAAAYARINEQHLAPLRALSWDEAQRKLHATREALLERLLAVPPEPAERWSAAHAFGAMLVALPRHDRHHAEQIRNARISR